MFLRTTLLLISFVATHEGTSQTCCSGGVPVSANLGMPQAQAKAIQFNLSYDLNVLNTLKAGSQVLADRTRKRTTHSLLLELGYSITDRWSVDVLLSGVRQERQITQSVGEDFTRTTGIGDATILTKYSLLNTERMSLTPGIGVKLPTGASDLLREDGIGLSADLQPGSGATDLIYWMHYALNGVIGDGGTLFLAAVHSRKGTNNEYRGSQAYKFGDEWQVSAGLSMQTIIKSWIAVPALAIRYRYASFDVIDDQRLPSTGGKWIFANPSVAVSTRPETSWTLSIDLPLMAKLKGTQVTPTYRINLAFYHKFHLSKNRSQ